MFWITIIASVIAVLSLVAEAADTLDDQAVTVLIYQLTTSKWDSGKDSEFKDSIVSAVNSWCDIDPGDRCDLPDPYDAFTSSGVELVADYPTYTSPYLTVKFALQYDNPSQVVGGSTTYLPASTLEVIIVNSDFDDFSHYIVKVNEEDLSIPPDATLNIALSVVGVVILIICLAVCLILNWKCGSDPEPVGSEEDVTDPKNGKTQPIELTSVETVKTITPREENNVNGAKTEPIAVET